MKKNVSIKFLLILALTVIICAALGLFIGTYIGGIYGSPEGYSCVNIKGTMVCDEHDEGFTYRGLQGYEGGGILGLHLGTLVGLGAGIIIWNRTRKA